MPTIEEARAWSPAHDPVHGFDHVLRVVLMAERLADEVGADREIVRAAALRIAAGNNIGTRLVALKNSTSNACTGLQVHKYSSYLD